MAGTAQSTTTGGASETEVLVTGAGPTGLALAAQLQSFGVDFRIIDRLVDRRPESRALAVQARTLEILQGVGIGERLVAAGVKSTRLVMRLEGRVAEAELGGAAAADTRFPFVLFVPQTETERVFDEHLAAGGVQVERGVELVAFRETEGGLACTLRRADGHEEQVHAQYLVGCDGAHSAVRKTAGIAFEGDAYAPDFLLGDVEVDGPITRGALNGFAGRGAGAMFFPLGHPRTWRVLGMIPEGSSEPSVAPRTSSLALHELQAVVDVAARGSVRVSEPAWLTRFRLHHRQAARYRSGRVFLAGDAAHIHSPLGGQGMNVGIQDAWNLGWKLALVLRGHAGDRVLDSYEAERRPVGQALLRTTDRAFGLFLRAISPGTPTTCMRRGVLARVLPHVLGSKRFRDAAFGFLSELRIHYRGSPVVGEGEPALAAGPQAGDRLPDAALVCDGRPVYLQEALSRPGMQLLLCDASGDGARGDQLGAVREQFGGPIEVRRLVRTCGGDGALVDASGAAFDRLGVRESAHYLVRPDGYIAFRSAGRDLRAVRAHLASTFDGAGSIR